MKIRIFCQIIILIIAVETWAGSYVFQTTKGLQQTWDTNDRVGITTAKISYGIMEQLSFWVSSKPGATRNENILFATGYQLKAGTTYYAYYPYRWIEEFDAYNLKCGYNTQTQGCNADASHIAKADYQMASATSSETSCSFLFQHIGGVMRVAFSAPEAMTIASMSIKAQAPAIATSATMDIVSKQVRLTDYATALTLQTQDITAEKGQEVILYLAAPAQDLSTTALDITLTTTQGKEITVATITGPNIKAGYLYDLTLSSASLSKSPAPSLSKSPALSSLSKSVVASMFRIEDPAPALTAVSSPTALTSDLPFDTSYTVHYVQKQKKGDVNADGDIDVLDAIAIVGYYTKGRTEDLTPSLCDMNNDGDIDILDAIAIIGQYTKGQK